MIRSSIESLGRWMRRVVTQPREELDRWQQAARFVYDLSRLGGRQLRYDRAPQMAAALAYRSLFALVPVLIVSMIVVKATQGTDAFLELTRGFLTALGLDSVRVIPPGETIADSAETSMSLATWLEGLVGQAARINLAAVGWIGFAVIAYAAISLMVTIENGFNTIFRAPTGRRWTRRIPLYWFILTVSPVAMGVTWYINGRVTAWIDSVDGWQTLLVAASAIWSVTMAWLVMLAVYMLVPNTGVALRPAMGGALVAALLLEIGRRSLDAYLGNAFAVSQLYGSLGLVPLFMFWVYLMWLAVLFGLEVCAILQRLGGRELEAMEPRPTATGLLDPASVIRVMEAIAARFADGELARQQQIAEACSLPEDIVELMLSHLVNEGLLHRVDGEAGAIALTRPPEKVPADQLIDIGFRMADEGGVGRRSKVIDRLRDAQREMLAQTTLAGLAAAEQ